MAQELFTLTKLGTFAGATTATVVVGNTLQSVFGIGAKWLALAVAEAIMVIVTAFTASTELSAYFLAILNGCLVYCSAVGINSMTAPTIPQGAEPKPRSANEHGFAPSAPAGKMTFLSRWR